MPEGKAGWFSFAIARAPSSWSVGIQRIQVNRHKLTLPSFSRYPPFHIVRVPGSPAKTSINARNQKRTHQRHVETTEQFLEYLPGDFTDELIISRMMTKPKKVKEMMTMYHKDLFRLSGVNSLVLQVFCNMNSIQVQKLGRCLYYMTGLHTLAPKQEMQILKDDYLKYSFTTKTHDNVVLQRKVAAGKKKGSIIM